MRLPKFTLPFKENIQEVQTDITLNDFSPTRIFTPKALYKITSDYMNNTTIPLKRSETREVLPKRNFYKEHLQNEILNWLQHVPLFYSLNFTTKDMNNKIVNNLAEKIYTLAVEAHDKNYEIKTKMEIDNCLDKLPMWLHGGKKDQILFKESLRENLWSRIQDLNENFLGIKYDKSIGYGNEENIKPPINVYEKEICDWSLGLTLYPTKNLSRRQVVDIILKRLSPLLKIPLHTTSYKLILKGEIIDILDDLPLVLSSPKYRTVHLNRFAEELANRLLSVQMKVESFSSQNSVRNSVVSLKCEKATKLPRVQSLNNLKDLTAIKIDKSLEVSPFCLRNDLISDICSSFLVSETRLQTGSETNVKDEIRKYLLDTGKTPKEKTRAVADILLKQVKDAIRDAQSSVSSTSFDSVRPQLTGAVSVYRWGSEEPPAASTPKKQRKKEIPKLSPEEISYMERVSGLIKVWMKTLPKQYNEDPDYKQTMIYDLAGEIADHLKLQQLSPDSVTDTEKYLEYIMYRWLYKFDFFDQTNMHREAKPLIKEFLRKLKDIPVPKLTVSHHGTRQAMEYIKHMEGERAWQEDYVAKGIDVLEDQISVWMNEQPSELYEEKEKPKRSKMVHDLALNLQDHLRNKSPESVIENDIKNWLGKVVNPKERENIGLLSQDLKDKIINVPQDQTLEFREEERKRYMIAKHTAKRKIAEEPEVQRPLNVSNRGNIQGDPDRTIREFIGKYIEHYYDIDDPLATKAFAHLLKTELRKLAPLIRQEVYQDFELARTPEKFRPETLNHELEYIKVISDWLNNIPIQASYNTPGNLDRIEFINDLAKNIIEIEQQRLENPDAMEYNYLTASMIIQSMHTYGLPFLPDQSDNTPLMVQQLLQKLVEKRPDIYLNRPPSPSEKSLSQSFNISDIKEQNLSDFIADYIRINGRDIADDEIKLEAWTARLMKEIKNMIKRGVDPATMPKAQVHEKFDAIPLPTEDAVKRYCLEIYYVKEITDWIKNLPLLPIENKPKYEEERVEMISELAEKMCDTLALKQANPNDSGAYKMLEDYIANWISRVPLDKSKEINLPILTQQLINRLEKGSSISHLDATHEKEAQARADISKVVGDDKTKKQNRTSLDNKDSKQSVSKRSSLSFSTSWIKSKPSQSPAEKIIEAIEIFSKKLPIKLDDKDAVQSIKDGIARSLYQKVGELNVDPVIIKDESLYREMLADEIDTQLENVPQNPELQKNREKIIQELLNTIIESNKVIKERSVGDHYRHKLETTIDASIPNPVQSTQAYDPGFEIYKNHLADMFILENFDHANDDVKAKYEKRIRHEIDKYFESAQNKNALPLTKDQIYNEIYSALFKVPMPNENSVINEVEIIKTRCEIDAWYEELPIQQTDNINELLERDQILATLAKRIHEIEKKDCKVDDNILKETHKWLEKLPLSRGSQGIEAYAKKLQTLLKATAAARKYVPADSKSKGKSKQVKESKDKKGKNGLNVSQVPGPSGFLQTKATNAKPCLVVTPMAYKKPGDIIVEVVEDWCNDLPLISTEENNKAIRDNVSTRIIIQISELNMDSEIFNDDVVYDELLGEELESIMSNIPVRCDFAKSIPARKYQLIEIIKSIKPLIKLENARHEYKSELTNTVSTILKEPQNTSADKLELFNKLKEEIVENFVQFHYNKNDEEMRQIYKHQIHDAVVKFCIEVSDNVTGEKIDPLVRRNQLLCELEKIPVPQAALEEEIAEIKTKQVVEQLFREQGIPEGTESNKMKKHLAKRLCDIEKSGYSQPNQNKMKTEITRCLKKLNKDVDHKVVEDFVNSLKNNESERRSPLMTRSGAARFSLSPGFPKSGKVFAYGPPTGMQTASRTSPREVYSHVPSESGSEDRWMSLQVTRNRMRDQSYHTPYGNEFGPGSQTYSPHAVHPFDQTMADATMDYDNFREGYLLSSSVAPQGYAPEVRPSPTGSYGRQPSQRSMNRSQPAPRLAEVTSGQIPARPSFGQIATPRQVLQSPRQSPAHGPTPGVGDNDSLFQAPIFQPAPFHRTLPVPILGPKRLQGSAATIGLRRPEDALAVSPRRPACYPMGDIRPRGFDGSDEEELCICERCTRRRLRRFPLCMLAMEHYLEDCLGIPMYYGMPMHECLFF